MRAQRAGCEDSNLRKDNNVFDDGSSMEQSARQISRSFAASDSGSYQPGTGEVLWTKAELEKMLGTDGIEALRKIYGFSSKDIIAGVNLSHPYKETNEYDTDSENTAYLTKRGNGDQVGPATGLIIRIVQAPN